MTRFAWLVSSVVVLLSCTDAREPASREPPSEPPEPVIAPVEFSPTPTTLEIEALALACDGPQLKAAFASQDLAELGRSDAGASVRLLATWESERRFVNQTVDPASVSSFVEALTRELGQAPPSWWVAQLATGRQITDDGTGPLAYDVGLKPDFTDRRGELVRGPGTTWIRPGVAMVLTESNGALAFDLSVARLELGPLPTEPDATLEVSRAHAGTTIYYAAFSRGSGGFRFPLHAISHHDGKLWDAEVCGPDRKILAGLGYLTVEIVALEPEIGGKLGDLAPRDAGKKQASSGATGIAVFTAESHGVALDVFDPATGKRTLAWSSDFWFSR